MTDFRLNEIPLKSELGQVWTPSEVASKMVDLISTECKPGARILDPASGPGTFLEIFLQKKIKFSNFDCFEIDDRLYKFMIDSFQSKSINIFSGDYFQYKNESLYDVAILNPPYIRHEDLSQNQKFCLQKYLDSINSGHFTKRMNLFGYFLIAASSQLKFGGVMCAIVYDSLNSTRYGQEIIKHLSASGKFVKRETISAPFKGRLIDAEIILWKKNESLLSEVPEIDDKKAYRCPENFCSISELAKVKRGTSFVKREYFVTNEPAPESALTQMVTKQPLKDGLIVKANAFGLFKSNVLGRDMVILDELKQVNKDPRIDALKTLPTPIFGDIIFNYYLRGNPRHLLNVHGYPASDNFYCLKFVDVSYILPHWVIANSNQAIWQLIKSSRKQGSGLRKLQLFEYSRCGIPDYRKFSVDSLDLVKMLASDAISENWEMSRLCFESTKLLTQLGYSANE